MADLALGSIPKIISLAQEVKKAVETVRENKKECRDIEKCVSLNSALLQLLEDKTEIMKSKVMREALLDVAESFEEALKLVNECQQRHDVSISISCWRYTSNLWKAGDLAKELRKVKKEIRQKVDQASLAAGVNVNILLTSKGSTSSAHLSLLPPGPTPAPPPANDQYCPAALGRGALKVVLLYAFDCTDYSPSWFKMEDVFWLVHEKLVHFAGSCLGYIYVMSTPNTYTCDMKLVDSAETQASGYKGSSFWHRTACNKSMACGLVLAHQLIRDGGESNAIILLFSDGLNNKGDFFDGAEGFDSKVPVHTFTLGGDAYNEGLRAIAAKSPGGVFNQDPVPDSPKLSMPFTYLMDSILKGTMNNSGRGPLDVVLVYGFDCTTSTPNWYKMDDVFWLVHEKLKNFADSYLGYIYVMSTPNTYTYDMKLVGPDDSQASGYKKSPLWRRFSCTKNMASGLSEAHKLVSFRGHSNGVILFFSDGMINKGDFFDGVDEFNSKVPVHTFTLGGDEYNEDLRTIARKSPGGTFNPLPVPDKPKLSSPFSNLLDSILRSTINGSGRGTLLDVVLLYGFDCTSSTPNWYKMDKIFWLVHAKLTQFVDSNLGYVYVMSTPNTYTSEMKLVHSVETEATGYKASSFWHRASCTKNMASGLTEAHKLISYREHSNGIILLFSDGLLNKGDFFDGAEEFISKVPVHTFTLGGDAYNEGLRAIAENSPKGTFNPVPVPDDPVLWGPFSHLLDTILNGTVNNTGLFDCTES